MGGSGWLALVVDDTGRGRGSIKTVQVKSASSDSWQDMNNPWGAFWELSSAPQPPLDFKFVCDDGEEVTASDVVSESGLSGGLDNPKIISTGVQGRQSSWLLL